MKASIPHQTGLSRVSVFCVSLKWPLAISVLLAVALTTCKAEEDDDSPSSPFTASSSTSSSEEMWPFGWDAAATVPGRTITTKYGRVKGLVTHPKAKTLKPVEAFLGVPYATPPEKDLRYVPPVTPPPWDHAWSADHVRPVCPQELPLGLDNETEALSRMPKVRYQFLKTIVKLLGNQSEDCLYMNIFVPTNPGNQRLAVVVFIHGESYKWNSGNIYDGSILAAYGGVVVITLNYRLGRLGFLNAKAAPDARVISNYGLMDQIAALHWIQENIAAFGGDPSSVTLMGHSEGAACIHLLMMYPAVATGTLFQRTILLSGSAYASWAIVPDPQDYAAELARHFNCSASRRPGTSDNTASNGQTGSSSSSSSSSSIIGPSPSGFMTGEPVSTCLRDVPVRSLLSAPVSEPRYVTNFGPMVDGVVVSADPRWRPPGLPALPKPFNVLLSLTSSESNHIFGDQELKDGFESRHRRKLLRTFVRNSYDFHLYEILSAILNEYTEWDRNALHPSSVRDSLVAALGDAQYVAPVIRVANDVEDVGGRAFMMLLEHHIRDANYPQQAESMFGDELPFIFGAPFAGSYLNKKRNFTRADALVSEVMMTYVSNFIKTGDPNIPRNMDDLQSNPRERNRYKSLKFPLYNRLSQKYIAIDPRRPKIKSHYRAHKLALWLNFIPELHAAGHEDALEGRIRHHLLPHFNDPMSYAGQVRQYHIRNATWSGILTTSTPKPGSSVLLDPSSAGVSGEDGSHHGGHDGPYGFPEGMEYPGYPHPSGAANYPPFFNASAAFYPKPQNGGLAAGYVAYSTALSVTIAIGCSLLILNVLIFAGVYYKKDGRRGNGNNADNSNSGNKGKSSPDAAPTTGSLRRASGTSAGVVMVDESPAEMYLMQQTNPMTPSGSRAGTLRSALKKTHHQSGTAMLNSGPMGPSGLMGMNMVTNMNNMNSLGGPINDPNPWTETTMMVGPPNGNATMVPCPRPPPPPRIPTSSAMGNYQPCETQPLLSGTSGMVGGSYHHHHQHSATLPHGATTAGDFYPSSMQHQHSGTLRRIPSIQEMQV